MPHRDDLARVIILQCGDGCVVAGIKFGQRVLERSARGGPNGKQLEDARIELVRQDGPASSQRLSRCWYQPYEYNPLQDLGAVAPEGGPGRDKVRTTSRPCPHYGFKTLNTHSRSFAFV